MTYDNYILIYNLCVNISNPFAAKSIIKVDLLYGN